MDDILDILVARGVPGDVIVRVAKLIADVERWKAEVQVLDRQRAAARQRMRDVRERSRTCPNGTEQGGILTSLSSLSTSLEKEERLEIVAPAKPATKFSYPAKFETFWQQYPRHAGKLVALKGWQKVIRTGKATNEELIAGAMRYAADPNRDPAYTKHGATWLAAGGWADDPLPKRAGQNGKHQHNTALPPEASLPLEERMAIWRATFDQPEEEKPDGHGQGIRQSTGGDQKSPRDHGELRPESGMVRDGDEAVEEQLAVPQSRQGTSNG